eukprot:GCRY01000647.1.p1 GENE.GCRY01000647.1~~GCRY01000647.1.p1  ORF type:complete len:344 (-),score=62.59 GCRY01000647.1:336-1367(-)
MDLELISIVLSAVVVAVVFFGYIALLNYIAANHPKKMSMEGKHVIITGGSSGIGLATAKALVRKGANVTLIARNEKKLKEAQEEVLKCRTGSVFCEILSLDVSDGDKTNTALTELAESKGVDVLIASAGITGGGKLFPESTNEDFRKVLDINYMGTVHCIRPLVNVWLKNKHPGRLVLVSSMGGQIGVPGYSPYASSKYALRGLTDSLSMELKPYGIYTSLVFPPDVDTPLLQEELLHRSPVTLAVTEGSKSFTAEAMAKSIVKGIEKWKFAISIGMDGFALGVVTAGMTPVHSAWLAFAQLSFYPIFRLATMLKLRSYDRAIAKVVKHEQQKELATESGACL